jgi:serine/threonine protein kinase
MTLIGNKYEIIEKINEGQFGFIMKGRNIRTGEFVAIKIEKKVNESINTLQMEAKIYQYIGKIDGFPQLKWYGVTDNYTYLVIDLLHNLTTIQGNLKEVLLLGIQMITRIEILHQKYLIHRDIKPSNFMIKESKLYLIDFGMCKRYETNGKHMKCKQLTKIIGTPNFVSLNVHNGIEPSRRDDIISIIYVMMYLLFGTLEWFYEKSIEKMVLMKQKPIVEPIIIQELLNYAYNMKFDEKPNYHKMKQIIYNII